jgi:ubiquinone/menaquinone biosynthesis C-methylase UbiE
MEPHEEEREPDDGSRGDGIGMITGVAAMRDAYRDEQVARTYVGNRFREPLGALLHARQVRALRRVIEDRQPRRTLEIAPGPGRLTVEVARMRAGEGVAVEASAQMLAEARRVLGTTTSGWRFLQGDAFHLPLQPGFQLVYVFRLIRHFGAAERSAIFEQIRRVLEPGGLLMFDAVNESVSAPIRARAPEEFQHFDAMSRPDALRDELAEAGFAMVSLEGVQHRYETLEWMQTFIAPRSRRLARLAMECTDRFTGGAPLEWIVVCRRV